MAWKDERASDRERAENARVYLEQVYDAQASEVLYDPDPTKTVIAEDFEFIQSYYELEPEVEPEKLSPWLLRAVLDRAAMVNKRISLQEIAERFNFEYRDMLFCVASSDAAAVPVLHVRYIRYDDDEEMCESPRSAPVSDDMFLKEVEETMMHLPLR